MNYEAIYHSADSEYCHAIDKNTVIIRLRAKRGDVERCAVFYGDRVCHRHAVRVNSADMHIAASDRFFDYYEAVICTNLTRLCYYFILSDGCESTYYYGYDFHDRLDYNRNLYFQLPYIREEDIAAVPDWVKRAVIYQIFPDSFASAAGSLTGQGKLIAVTVSEKDTVESTADIEDSDAYSTCSQPASNALQNVISSKSRLGGGLRGIIENIPYLEELGITCIYLTPIFTAGEYHKYDTIDYLSVDPCFGDLQTFKELVAKCHIAGIRVILDGVFNHCGADFFAFRDVVEKGETSEYKDWFFIKSFPISTDSPNYETFAYVRSMPKLNTGNAEVVKYFCDIGVYWIKEADIDGWRLDVADEINHDFWREFRKAVKAAKPDAFLVGETWYDAVGWLKGDQLDSLMNYSFLYTCTDFFAKRVINVKQFSDRIGYLLMRYKRNIQYVQMNLLDSHDVPRFLSQAEGDIKRLKLAVLFMMMHIGAPTVFYGDEKGFVGMSENEYRRPMQWEDTEYSQDIFDYYKKLISIRKEYMDLMLGGYVTRDVDIANNTLVFSREADDRRLYVVINNSEFPVEYSLEIIPEGCGDGSGCEDGGGDESGSGSENADAEGIGANTAKFAIDLMSGNTYKISNSRIVLYLEELSGVIVKIAEA